MRWTVGIVAASSLSAGAALAGTVSIPWDVTFPALITNPAPPQVADLGAGPFDGAFSTRRGGLDAPGLDVRAGLSINTESTLDSIDLILPLEAIITAPDVVRAGQNVVLETGFRLRPGAPARYAPRGELSFDTSLDLEVQSDTFGIDFDRSIDLPDEIEFEGFEVTLGGEDDYEGVDTTPTRVRSRNRYSEDPFGQFLIRSGNDFDGFEFTATDQIDGVEAGVDLYDLAAAAFPVLAPASPLVDVPLNIGADLTVTNTLSTNVASAFYTYTGLDNDGFGFDDITLNRAQGGPVLQIPSTAVPGTQFDVFFSALGLGFNNLTEVALAGNVDLELALDLLFREPSIELLSLNFGELDPFDRTLTAYYFLQFIAEFADPADFVLSFQVAEEAGTTVTFTPDVPPPTSADAQIIEQIVSGALSQSAAVPLGQVFELPEPDPIVLPIEAVVIPLPASLSAMLTGLGLLTLAVGLHGGRRGRSGHLPTPLPRPMCRRAKVISLHYPTALKTGRPVAML